MALAAASTVVEAADYVAYTQTAAILRAAPMLSSAQLGVLPAGTILQVITCFEEGTYCKVEGEGIAGFVAGQLLFVEGTGESVDALERARWETIRATPSYWEATLGTFGSKPAAKDAAKDAAEDAAEDATTP